MNLPTSIHQVIAHFIPGFVFLLTLFFAQHQFSFDFAVEEINKLQSPTIISFITIASSLFIGLLFDAIRTGIFEEGLLIECKKKGMANLERFFTTVQEDDLKIFEKYYYAYYVFECNICISLAILSFIEGVMILQNINCHNCSVNLSLLLYSTLTFALFIVFAWDLKSHICYMYRYIDAKLRCIEAKCPDIIINQRKEQDEC